MRYPKELKEQVLKRMMPPVNEPVAELSAHFNVTTATLYNWRREALLAGVVAPGKGRAGGDWRAQAKFAVVLETAAVAEGERGEYCRAKGLYPEQVAAWREACEAAFLPAAAGEKAASQAADKKRIRQLERELLRKEKALAEAAALLVLRKKAAAIWGEDEDA